MNERDSGWAHRCMYNSESFEQADVSIIIRSKNEERFIGQVLSAIFEQEIDLFFEVIVIDSGSTDGTLDVVRSHPVRLYGIDAQKFTYGGALNHGARLAKGRYLINLSAHCIPADSHWMKKLIGGLRSNERVAAAYGRQLPIKGMNPFEERLLLATFLPDENGRMWPPFSNANCAIRKETWKQFPFDEKASFAEDFIWSQFLPAGTEIKYIAEAAVYHTHPLRLKYWAKRSYDNGVFVQYLKHVYGLQYRWVASNSGSRAASAVSGATRFCAMLARRAARSLEMIAFLIENGYLRFIPLLPIYVALEGYYYHRGLVDGLKLYGPARVR